MSDAPIDPRWEKILSLSVHEFRTPMTVVAGYIRMLLKDRAGPLSDQQRKLLEEAEKSCARLTALLRPDSPGRPALLLAGATAAMAASFRGLTVEARRGRTGLLLGSLAPADGDLLGVQVARSRAAAPPGRGLLVVRGRAMPVQVACSLPSAPVHDREPAPGSLRA